jgi:orotidine-5'-phosphate decarboxylase
MPQGRKPELIVVLDVDTRHEVEKIIEACEGCQWFKVGSQLFTREGPHVVQMIQDAGKSVFLDLKFHDIPNTVSHAVAAAADLKVGLLTLHALGGTAMIEKARKAVVGAETKLLAVTILTSHGDETLKTQIGLHETAAQAVPRLAAQSVQSGAHGIVCSPKEIALVREAVGPEALVVTPGIRPTWSEKNDQVRVMTPGEAVAAGADMLVIGRPILHHANPAEAVARIKEEMHA